MFLKIESNPLHVKDDDIGVYIGQAIGTFCDNPYCSNHFPFTPNDEYTMIVAAGKAAYDPDMYNVEGKLLYRYNAVLHVGKFGDGAVYGYLCGACHAAQSPNNYMPGSGMFCDNVKCPYHVYAPKWQKTMHLGTSAFNGSLYVTQKKVARETIKLCGPDGKANHDHNFCAACATVIRLFQIDDMYNMEVPF